VGERDRRVQPADELAVVGPRPGVAEAVESGAEGVAVAPEHAVDEAERHRLVGAFFGAYERAAPGFTAGRRERDLPVVGESVDELDRTLDALVAEALRPLRPDGVALTSVRALTDVEVWRALRDQGATADAAVEQAGAAVERWLDARA
jgi:hypothetical protein